MTISENLKDDAWSQESDLPLALLEINHDELENPLRVVNNKEDIISNGETYIAFPFEIQLPNDKEDAAPQAKLRICNVSREIGQAIRLMRTPADVSLRVVRMDTPDVVELEFFGLKLRNVNFDAFSVEGTLVFENLVSEPFPWLTFSPAWFPGLVP